MQGEVSSFHRSKLPSVFRFFFLLSSRRTSADSLTEKSLSEAASQENAAALCHDNPKTSAKALNEGPPVSLQEREDANAN